MNIESVIVYAIYNQGIAIIVIGMLFCACFILIYINAVRELFEGRTMRAANRLLNDRQFDAAIVNYSRAIAKHPKNIRAYLGRSSAYILSGSCEKAIADCNTVIELDPQVYDAYLNRGAAHQINKDHQQAIADFSKCIELQPNRTVAFANRGYLFAQLDAYDEGVADLSKAILLDPADAGLYFWRGWLHLKHDALDEAVADLSKALDCGYPTHDIFGFRAHALSRLREFKKAIADYEAAIREHPDNSHALNGLAWILSTCPNPELRNGSRAVKLATESCRLLNNSEWYCIGTLAAAFAETGNFARAIELAKNSLEMAPDDEKQDCEERLKLYEANQPYRIPDSTLD